MKLTKNIKNGIHKNIFACLFSVHNTISLHVMNKYVYDGRSISRNAASLTMLVHDVINLLYYKKMDF